MHVYVIHSAPYWQREMTHFILRCPPSLVAWDARKLMQMYNYNAKLTIMYVMEVTITVSKFNV